MHARILAALALTSSLLACPLEIPYVDPGDANVTTVEAQNAREWALFDFTTGQQLEGPDGLPLMVDSPGEEEGWDLAISQFVLATPSGLNTGDWSLSRGATELVAGDEEAPPSIGAPGAQVRCSDIEDGRWEGDTEADPDLAGPVWPRTPHNERLARWFRYVLATHQAIPNFAVYAMEDRDGRCLRVQFVDYYDETDESGFLTFYWQYLEP